MNCFNHKNKSAIGTCKCCCKGICTTCHALIKNILICKNINCKKKASEELVVWEKIKKIYMIGKENKKLFTAASISYLFIGIVGIMFASLGLLRNETDWFAICIGTLFITISLYQIFRPNKLNV